MPDLHLRGQLQALFHAGHIEPRDDAGFVGNPKHLAGTAQQGIFRTTDQSLVTEYATVAQVYDRLELRPELAVYKDLQQRVQLRDIVLKVVQMREGSERRN